MIYNRIEYMTCMCSFKTMWRGCSSDNCIYNTANMDIDAMRNEYLRKDIEQLKERTKNLIQRLLKSRYR